MLQPTSSKNSGIWVLWLQRSGHWNQHIGLEGKNECPVRRQLWATPDCNLERSCTEMLRGYHCVQQIIHLQSWVAHQWTLRHIATCSCFVNAISFSSLAKDTHIGFFFFLVHALLTFFFYYFRFLFESKVTFK